VETEASARPSFLLCPPKYFDTHFLFNPWMTYRERVNRHRALRQWRDLCSALEQAGAAIELIEPSPESSAMVYTADAGLVLDGTAILFENDGPRGDLEPPLFRAWFRDHGYETESLPGTRMDGGNLVRLHNGSYAVGLKPGVTGHAEAYLRKRLSLTEERGLEPIGLIDRRYLHLDMVLGNVGDKLYVVYTEALYSGDSGLPIFLTREREVVYIDREEVEAFVPNLITVGDVVITGRVSERLRRRIVANGFWVEELPLTEFYKAGGGAKCLTLPLGRTTGGQGDKSEANEGSRSATGQSSATEAL
jgi:N-dimethylarginine dimethylaminohydrolase